MVNWITTATVFAPSFLNSSYHIAHSELDKGIGA